jgi:hypothetical protein
MEAMFRTSLENKPKERTVQDLIDEQHAIRTGAGLGDEAGKAKLERIAEMKQQYADTQMTPMQELIAMLGQSGQYKGLSGLAPAYTSMAAKKRAADAAQAKSINELMGGVEDTQRAEKIGIAGKVGEGRTKDRDLGSQFDREKMQSLGAAYTSEGQRKTQERGQDLTFQAAMAQVKAAAAQRGDSQEIAKINAASQLAARDETINNWQAQLKELAKMPISANKAKMVAIEKQINDRTKAIYGQFGITIPEAPGAAASPGGTSKPGWGKASVV